MRLAVESSLDAGRPRHLLGVVGGLSVLGLATYGIVDVVVFGVDTAQRVAYALVWVAILLSVLMAMRRAQYSKRAWRFFATWLFMVTLPFLSAAGQAPFYPGYAAGDFASVILPALILLIGLAVPAVFAGVALGVVGIALSAGMMVAPLLGSSGDRFEAPSALLIATAFWLLVTGRGWPMRLLGVLLAAATLMLSLASGQRTSVMIWLAMLGCAMLIRIGVRGALISSVCLLAIALGPARGIVMSAVQSSLQTTRFSTVVKGESDESLLTRVREGADVLGTLRREGSAATWIIGFGHGATYRPRLSYVARNVTEAGRVHHIHIGPMLLLFRYGALGLTLGLLLTVAASAVLVRSSRGRAMPGPAIASLFAMAVLAYMIKGLMFNILIEPLFSYVVAGFLFHSIQWQPVSGTISWRRQVTLQGLRA